MMTKTTLRLPGAELFDTQLAEKLREALQNQGPNYVPRTHHLGEGGTPKYINRLILEASPYLLQHAHNPVNWRAWGDAAFEAARTLDRPVLLSVGYSTCHWCHVMERESFEDLEIAEFINSHFIAIKVDREERPDVDSVYMTAVQLMTGRGGWPMTVVMTPDGRPYFGGTYFPPHDGDRGMRIGFLSILRKLHDAYVKEREQVVASADRLSQALQRANRQPPPAGMPTSNALTAAAQILAKRFDTTFGGFGRAPKFPRPSVYEMLLRYWRRTGDEVALRIVSHSLTRMMRGGIYDHVAGGFARYSTDQEWLVPHFEKMLYDNAQLVSLLIETYQATGDTAFAEVARETLDYVLREMTSDAGGFFSATDADSEGEEGKFFVWTPEQIDTVVGETRGRIVKAYFAVTPEGNFEGHSILHRPREDDAVAKELGLSVDDLRSEIAAAKAQLYAAREQRIHPLLDDKIITEWNGQMIGAFAKAGFALDEAKFIAAAEKAARFVLDKLSDDRGRLLRAFRKDQARHGAVLEDYAFFIAGLLDLYEATGRSSWLDEVIRLQAIVDKHFLDEVNGGYFGTPDDGPKLLVREKPLYDGAQPSGNSVCALNLLRLATFTTNDQYKERGARTLLAFGQKLADDAEETPKLALALDYYLDEAKEIVVVGDGPDRDALTRVLRATFLPNRAFAPAASAKIPWTADKRTRGGRPTAYVCLQQICKKPTSDPEEFRRQLEETVALQAPPLKTRER